MKQARSVTNKMIITVALIAFGALFVLWAIAGAFQDHNTKYDITLDEHWTVVKNGITIAEDADISDVTFGNTEVGDELVFMTPLTREIDQNHVIQILFYLCSVEAYVGDECIYSYGTDLIGRNVMVGSGYHFLALPDRDFTGEMLTIKTVMNEPNAFTSIAVPRATIDKNTTTAFASSQFINIMISMFLAGLGIILFGVSLVAVFYDKVYTRLIYIGLFSLCMGLWTFFTNKVGQIFSENLVLLAELEYISLLAAPVPFAWLMHAVHEKGKDIKSIIVKVMAFVFTLFFVLAMVLHYTNTLRFPRILSAFHIVAFSGIVVLVFITQFTVKDKSMSDSFTAIGLVIISLVLGLDIARFNLQKYFLPNSAMLMNSLIPLGTLVFVILLIVSYISYIYDMVMSNTEKETLTRLAYHDVLTGLFNRAKYEEVLNEIDSNSDNFALISIDLNDLKYINDTFGHNKGDLMLTTFAMILRKNFGNIGQCFRTGGDEYIVLVDGDKLTQINQALVDLENDESEESGKQSFDIKASYGIAYRTEIADGQAFKVFRLADRRMYEMKSQSKGREYVFAGNGAKI